jgi:two-component system LytT family response regulator
MAAEWTVMLADDEPAARRGVRQLLAAFPDFVVVSECRNGAEVLAALDEIEPHVLFLDVQMPGVDGLEVIRRRTPERMPLVVFLTAWDHHALAAFEAQALDYLVKPVSEARFALTARRLAQQLRARAPSPGRLVVSTPRGAVVLPLREVDWVEAAGNYARVWMGERSYLLRESLGELERRVRPHGFARAHRGALVRLDGVRELVESEAGGLLAVLACGARIPVSRRRRAAFVSAVRSLAGASAR